MDMRYAGPREGLLHACFRQNYGVSRMIIGRDHAGVGDFYGMFEAQTIFDKIPQPEGEGKALLCKPLKIDWTFYCYKCDGMASLRTCPHAKEDRVLLSGTMLRKLLSEGGEIPDHFGRDEVLVILREYYEGLTKKGDVFWRLPFFVGLRPSPRVAQGKQKNPVSPLFHEPTGQSLFFSLVAVS
jgi:sulfate adenylyltransferase